MNFGEIKTKVENYINRSDLTNDIPFWVNIAMRSIERENNFNYMLSTTTSLTIGDGTRTVSAPSDYKEVVWWYLEDDDNKNFLDRVTPSEIEVRESDLTPVEARPKYFAVRGSSLILAPTSDASYSNTMLYYAYSSTLTDDTDTNTLTDDIPEILVYGALMEAETYIIRDERFPLWQARYRNALNELRGTDNSDRLGESPALYRV